MTLHQDIKHLGNPDRYFQTIMDLGEITEPDKQYTRRSFSERFLEGRAWLTQKMQQAGLTVFVDEAGNLIGRKVGKRPELGTIAIGSHSDSVPSGGRFDGIAGVLAGLECATCWHENGIELNHNLEVIDFLAEEPSEWGISCVGSRGITNFLTDDLLNATHPTTQETLKDAISRMGGKPDNLAVREDIKAFFELHIEQARVLESTQLAIGVVSGIAGITRMQLVFEGRADHAGATPMDIRQDALVCAADCVMQATHLANELAKGEHYFVSTCGQLINHPNAANVVSGRTKIVFDIRSSDFDTVKRYVEQLHDIAKQCAKTHRGKLVEFTQLTQTRPTYCDSALMQLISDSCQQLNLTNKIMPSGAGHDASFMTHITPSAMIFVPSLDGKSHCAEEWTSLEEMGAGLNVLASSILRFDNQAN